MIERVLLDDVQAGVIKPHNRNFTLFLFFNWKAESSPDDCKKWLKDVGSLVTSHYQQVEDTIYYKLQQRQAAVINLGLTYPAYVRLYDSEKAEALFSEEIDYRNEMSPDSWLYTVEYSGSDKHPHIDYRSFIPAQHHVLISIAHDLEEELDNFKENICQKTEKYSIVLEKEYLVAQKRSPTLPGQFKGKAVGPLGMEDSISNLKDSADILQYAFGLNSGLQQPERKLGTFMILQKILLHRQGFETYSASLAKEIKKHNNKAADSALGKAYLIGRFPNGTPLTLSTVATPEKRNEQNQFDYQEDWLGTKCPRHAHIRTANPRHQGANPLPIVRRSIVFNEERKNSIEESMLFISYQSSVHHYLRPIYERMMIGKEDGKRIVQDALFYPHRGEGKTDPLEYHPNYGIKAANTIKFNRPGAQICTIGDVNLYFCPSLSYLDSLK